MQSARRVASFRLSYAGGRCRGSAEWLPAWQDPQQLVQTISVSERGVTQVHFGSLGTTVSNRGGKKKKKGWEITVVITWWRGSGKFFIPSLYPSLFINTKEQWVITQREDAAQGLLCFRFWLQIKVWTYSLLDKKNRNYKCMERKNNHRPVQISCFFPAFGNRNDTPLGWCSSGASWSCSGLHQQGQNQPQQSQTTTTLTLGSASSRLPQPDPVPSALHSQEPFLGAPRSWARGQRSPSPWGSLPAWTLVAPGPEIPHIPCELLECPGKLGQTWGGQCSCTFWKWPWCWERLKARGEGDNRGWDG